MKKMGKKKMLGVFICIFIVIVVYSNSPTQRFLEPGNDLGTVEGWEFNTSRDASLYVLSDNSTILKPKDFCESPTFLLIIVCTAPPNEQNRNAIRQSWGSQRNVSGSLIKVFFLMGDSNNASIQQDILDENVRHKDIIQDHFFDSYNNLTLKSIVMLKLVSTYCIHSTTFLMKTDDDMYLNIPPLVHTLKAGNSTNILLGSLICGAKPIKEIGNKWYTPSYMYSGKVYPNYLSGTGYVMSLDVASKLYEAALQTPIFHLEDVYITGILSKSVKLRPRNNGGFTFVKRKYDPCVFKTAFTSHRLSPMEIRDQYSQLQVINLEEECRLLQLSKNNSFNIFGYFSNSKAKPKKKKLCY